jgi:hypothetical protein
MGYIICPAPPRALVRKLQTLLIFKVRDIEITGFPFRLPNLSDGRKT